VSTSLFAHGASDTYMLADGMPMTVLLVSVCRRAQQIDDLLRQFPGCRAINADRKVAHLVRCDVHRLQHLPKHSCCMAAHFMPTNHSQAAADLGPVVWFISTIRHW
jgi:hypothetical protein